MDGEGLGGRPGGRGERRGWWAATRPVGGAGVRRVPPPDGPPVRCLAAGLPPRLQQRAHPVPAPHHRPEEAAWSAGETPTPPPSTQTPAHGLPHGHHVPLGVAFPVFESRPCFPAPLLGKKSVDAEAELAGRSSSPTGALRAAWSGGGAEFLGAFLIQALGGTGGIRGGIAAALLGEKSFVGEAEQ